MRLQDKVAVITGAASGIGEGTARRFVAEGAKVVIADFQPEAGIALADELGEAAIFQHTDVTDEAQVAAAVDAAVSTWGRLDVMFTTQESLVLSARSLRRRGKHGPAPLMSCCMVCFTA